MHPDIQRNPTASLCLPIRSQEPVAIHCSTPIMRIVPSLKTDKARKAAQPTSLPGNAETLLEFLCSETCVNEVYCQEKEYF